MIFSIVCRVALGEEKNDVVADHYREEINEDSDVFCGYRRRDPKNPRLVPEYRRMTLTKLVGHFKSACTEVKTLERIGGIIINLRDEDRRRKEKDRSRED